MTDRATGEPHLAVSIVELAYQWFQRAVALCCLALGLGYWVRLVGFYDGALWRFDLMPAHWQVASVVLATLFPFAASGLWMLASWGPAIWFICAAAETIMYAGLADLYGPDSPLVATHAAVLVLFIAFRTALFLDRRRREDPAV